MCGSGQTPRLFQGLMTVHASGSAQRPAGNPGV